MQRYELLTVEAFGAHLLDTNDLDPLYVALSRWGVTPAQCKRWLVAYWCFYHAGVACWIAEHEGAAFWDQMQIAARNEFLTPLGGRWPRGHERRHFRGEAAQRAVAELAERYRIDPGDMVNYIIGRLEGRHQPRTFANVVRRVREHRQFGPWMAFKIADMIDRTMGVTVNFGEDDVFMYRDPAKAALMLWAAHHPDDESRVPQTEKIGWVVERLRREFRGYLAPPRYERPIGVQEIETILCKWKSHCNGHYPLYNDIDDINAGLQEWAPHAPSAELLLRAMPKRGLPRGGPT